MGTFSRSHRLPVSVRNHADAILCVVPSRRPPRHIPIVSPYWPVGLLGVFFAVVVAYQVQRALQAALLNRVGKGTIPRVPLGQIGLFHLGSWTVPYGVVAYAVWGFGVVAMTVACAICVSELIILVFHRFPAWRRILAFAVTGVVAYYCGTWLAQVTYRLPILPHP
jgi:hypothetical protein